jgi:hypothetical protein
MLGAAAALFGVMLCINTGSNNDLFWQLRTGHDILATHTLPHANTYSYVRAGSPWVVHEWLTFVLFALAYAQAGFAGVFLFQAVLVGIYGALLYAIALREMRAALPALGLTVVAELTSASLLEPRPQLFTYIGFAGLCWLIRSAQSQPRRIYAAVPFFVLWANLHAGVVVGVALLGVSAVCAGVQASLYRGRAASPEKHQPDEAASDASTAGRHLGLATLLCAAATLINPYAWHIYQNLAQTINNTVMLDNVTEWKSPDFHLVAGRTLEVFLGLTLFGLLASRERRGAIDVILVAYFAHESLHAIRNAPLLAIVGVAFAGRHIESAIESMLGPKDSEESIFFARRPRGLICGVLLLTTVALCAMRTERVLALTPGAASGLTRLADASVGLSSFPDAACRFVEGEGFPRSMRLYNSYDDGGFLIWRLPEFPVFADGRADIYFGAPLERVHDMTTVPYDWSAKIDPEHPDFALLGVDEQQARLFLQSPRWALVYVDRPTIDAHGDAVNNSFIFIRREPRYRTLIDRCRRDCPAYAQVRAAYPDYAAAD